MDFDVSALGPFALSNSAEGPDRDNRHILLPWLCNADGNHALAILSQGNAPES